MKAWMTPSKPSDIQPVPWLSPEAIVYLEGMLTHETEVMEFGAGGSTLWFAERVKHVYSYENDPDWMAVLRKNKPDNVTLYFESFPRESPRVDLLFIDGEPVELRGEWLAIANTIVKQGGLVVLDNANRPEYAKELEAFAKTAKLLKRTALVWKHGVTEFYQCE